MDLWQLNVFCKVVENRSFSKAADAIYISQPTVSSHIKYLEDHFGCVLIDRLGKEAVATRAGELLYGYSKKLLALRDEAESAMSDFLGRVKGRLVIGGSTIPGEFILPGITGEFAKKFPDVTTSIVIGDTENIVEKILSGDVEIGIVGARSDNNKIVQEKYLDDKMRLIVPSEHKWARKKRISLDMLLKEPFIIREKGSGTLKSLKNSLSHLGYGIEDLKIVAEMGSTISVIQGIKQKIGVSILSEVAVTEELKAGTLKSLTVDKLNLKRSFYLTWHKLRSFSPLGSAFLKYIISYCIKNDTEAVRRK